MVYPCQLSNWQSIKSLDLHQESVCVCAAAGDLSADVMHWLVRLYQHVDIKRCLTRVLYVNIQSLNCRKAISRIKPIKSQFASIYSINRIHLHVNRMRILTQMKNRRSDKKEYQTQRINGHIAQTNIRFWFFSVTVQYTKFKSSLFTQNINFDINSCSLEVKNPPKSKW